MRFDLMNPAAYSGGAGNTFLSSPNPQMNFLQALTNFSQPQAMPGAPALEAPGMNLWAGGLGGTLGDQPGDFAMPTMASNNGWAAGATGAAPAAGGSWWSDFSRLMGGGKNKDGTSDMGLGSSLVGGLSAMSNLYMGMKQYGLMKDQLSFAKDSFAKNWGAQVQTTNNALEDRQAARVASNAGAYQSVGDYMKKNALKA